MNAAPKNPPSPAPLCPSPRSGMQGASGVILHILLALAVTVVGVGISAMRTTSAAEVRIAEGVSAAAALLLAVYLWRVTRTAKAVIPVLILVGAFLAYLTNSLIPTGVLVGLIFSISQGSFLLAIQPKSKLAWIPVIPMVAYAATLALSQDPIGSIAVLIPFPPMLVLAWGTRNSAERENGLTRVGVLCATSLALGLSLGAMILLSAYRQLGTLAPSAIADAVETYRAALIQQITSVEIPTEGLNEEALEEMKEMLSYANVSNAVNSTFNMLPALAVVAVNLISAVVQLVQHASLRAFHFGDSITDRVRIFRMSLISCIVFLIAYLIAMTEGTEASTMAGTVALNVYIILMPGLALAGMLRIVGSLARKGARQMGCLFYLVILIPCLFLFAPFVLAAFEVIGHIFEAITSAIKPPDDDEGFGNPPDHS